MKAGVGKGAATGGWARWEVVAALVALVVTPVALVARDRSHMHDICSDGNWPLDY